MKKKLINTTLQANDTVSIKGHSGKFTLIAMDYVLTTTYSFAYWIALNDTMDIGTVNIVTANEDYIELISRRL